MNIVPLSDALGAEVIGVNLKQPLSSDEVNEIKTAFLKYLLLCLKFDLRTPNPKISFCSFVLSNLFPNFDFFI